MESTTNYALVEEKDVADGSTPVEPLVYACCLVVFVVSFTVGGASLLAPFLAESPVGLAVGDAWVGVVFAAYPLATACATPLPPHALQRYGSRATVSLGLLVVSLSLLMFGMLPRLIGSHGLGFALMSCRAVGGVGAALCEAGCLSTISGMGWGDHLGKAMAGVEVATGVGAAIGAALGGVAYQACAHTPTPPHARLRAHPRAHPRADQVGERLFGAFLTPLLVAALLPMCTVPAVLALLPPVRPAPEDSSPLGQLVTLPRLMICVSLLFAGAACEGLNPLFESRFTSPPYLLEISQVGLLISAVPFAYMVLALPLGWLTDTLNTGSGAQRRLQLLQAAGWGCMLLSATLLGPADDLLQLAGAPPAVAYVGFPLLGASCSLLIIPSLPDMQRGLTDSDEPARNALCALWNGVYCLGSSLGPMGATMLFGHGGWDGAIAVLIVICAAMAALLGVSGLLHRAASTN